MNGSFGATLDAVEAGVARLVLDDGAVFTLPARLLPPGTREGDRLEWTVRRDEAGTARARAHAAALRRSLSRDDDGGDIEL
jgi:hypothetical protein